MAFASALSSLSAETGTLTVQLSNELIRLLSEQLYQSPLKAIEELVVNAYDADAQTCKVLIPSAIAPRDNIIVFDNGVGMNADGLRDLWHIGHSSKRTDEVQRRITRRQIGRFGIGKLATYTLANKVTYVSRVRAGEILAVSLDYACFDSDPEGAGTRVSLSVRKIDPKAFCESSEVSPILVDLGISNEQILNDGYSFTFAILEDLKAKAAELHGGRLTWILETAMPASIEFAVSLNQRAIESYKEAANPLVKFGVNELSDARIEKIFRDTGVQFVRDANKLVSSEFPLGISGSVIVSSISLHTGKSVDLIRGNGFFVRVRDRLVNEEDGLFGLHALTHEVYNRFRADVNVDDLDDAVMAGREGVSDEQKTEVVRALLLELFNEARSTYDALPTNSNDVSGRKEHEREYVHPRFAEQAVADALVLIGPAEESEERKTFYIEAPARADFDNVVSNLYTAPRSRFTVAYEDGDRGGRFVKLDVAEFKVTINATHELAMSHFDDPRSRRLLEDIAIAEALLEAYLLNAQIPEDVVGDLLSRRDFLLRSLAQERLYSLRAIASSLRDAASSERDLEVALVTAFRALGFNTEHVSDGGKPDGVASYLDFINGDRRITLEAKSSKDVPSLPAIDMAGLAEHRSKFDALGTVLLAPSYPGSTKGDKSALAYRAREARVSCWSIDDLARVVESAESHRITAEKILNIVLKKFTPDEVHNEVEGLLSVGALDDQGLAQSILRALKALADRLPGSPRDISMVAGEVSREDAFKNIKLDEIKGVIEIMQAFSRGMLVLSGNNIIINGSLDELSRRLSNLTLDDVPPRRNGGRFSN